MTKKKTLIISCAVLLIIILLAIYIAGKASHNNIKNMPQAEGTAYSQLVAEGYCGTPEQLLAAMVSEIAESQNTAYDFVVKAGYSGNFLDWLTTVLDGDGSWKTVNRSSYAAACESGFTGTEEQWAKTLAAVYKSNKKSAYDSACENGFEGTAAQWLDCLKGYIEKENTDIYTYASKHGFKGSETELLISIVANNNVYGKGGKSSYALAQDNGFTGSMEEWLRSLLTDSEANEAHCTLYNAAVKNGYSGSFMQWLCFLSTPQYQMLSPYQVIAGKGYSKSLQEFLLLTVTEQKNATDYYDAAVISGYTGTEEEWLAILSARYSTSPYDTAVQKGFQGTQEDFYGEIVRVLNGGEADRNSVIAKVYINEEKHIIVELRDDSVLDIGKTEVEADTGGNNDNGEQKQYYTVTFKDFDGTVIAVKIAAEGGTVLAPPQPARDGYLFTGWDKAFDSVKENITVTAVYEESNETAIITGNIKAMPGATDVTVAVSVRNNPGILGMALTCNYDDSVMTLKSVENGSAVAGVLTLSKSKTLESGCRFTWDGLELQKNDIKDGEILVMHFDIDESALNGIYPISLRYEADGIVNSELNSVSVNMVDGSIEIVN